VEQGTSNQVLDVAVGHDPYSVWPGVNGTAVFNAHDVSYFSNINRLKTGDVVRYETNCTAYEFQVQSFKVVKAGTTVYNTPGPSVTLVTCWPTNALWFTPNRYLVTAVEVGQKSLLTSGAGGVLANEPPPKVPAPAALVAQGLTLATNYIPMGSMTLADKPSASWAQSPGPLTTEAAGLEAYIGAVRSLAAHRLDWWRDLAPTIAPPAPLVGAGSISYLHALDVTVVAHDAVATGVSLTTTVGVSGGPSPGTYDLTMDGTIVGGVLTISSWRMSGV
jgi:LPXTG-site transpeptidase (sortase) family protein